MVGQQALWIKNTQTWGVPFSWAMGAFVKQQKWHKCDSFCLVTGTGTRWQQPVPTLWFWDYKSNAIEFCCCWSCFAWLIIYWKTFTQSKTPIITLQCQEKFTKWGICFQKTSLSRTLDVVYEYNKSHLGSWYREAAPMAGLLARIWVCWGLFLWSCHTCFACFWTSLFARSVTCN